MPAEIVEDALYAQQINSYRVNWERLDEAMMSLSPALLNSPQLFPLVKGTKLRRLKLMGFPGVPPLSIFFTYDDRQVILRAAEIIGLEE